MERVYFISYEVKTKLGKKKDMFEVTLPRKIRNFHDIKNVANLIENNLTPILGECEVVVLFWKELEESMEQIRSERERLAQEMASMQQDQAVDEVEVVESEPIVIPVEQ